MSNPNYSNSEPLEHQLEQGKELVSIEESLALAKKLYEKHRDQILRDAMYKREAGGGIGLPNADNHKQLEDILEQYPEEVLSKFRGHGITRAGLTEYHRLASFINSIQNKTIKGMAGPLKGGYEAYTHADFFVISHFDKGLFVEEFTDGKRRVKKNEIGGEILPGAFIVNDAYYSLVEELKVLFPNAPIIRANEVPNYIAAELHSVSLK